jgi:hypothetical protein
MRKQREELSKKSTRNTDSSDDVVELSADGTFDVSTTNKKAEAAAIVSTATANPETVVEDSGKSDGESAEEEDKTPPRKYPLSLRT